MRWSGWRSPSVVPLLSSGALLASQEVLYICCKWVPVVSSKGSTSRNSPHRVPELEVVYDGYWVQNVFGVAPVQRICEVFQLAVHVEPQQHSPLEKILLSSLLFTLTKECSK